MNGVELSPSTPRHTATVPLSLDIDQRFELLHELKDLSTELQENPFVKPAVSTVDLKGITLRPVGSKGPTSHMSLRLRESDDTHFFASLALTSDQPNDDKQRTYTYSPLFNDWEVWRPGAPKTAHISNSSLIAKLEPHLPNGTLESVMDTPSSTGKEVAYLLAHYLKSRARTRKYHQHYQANGIQVGDSEYTRDTDFIVNSVNGRIARKLFVAASFDFEDLGHIRKVYLYGTTHQQGYLRSTDSTVSISADTHVPKTRLHDYGLRDPIRNDPSDGIRSGVQDIRSAYVEPSKV